MNMNTCKLAIVLSLALLSGVVLAVEKSEGISLSQRPAPLLLATGDRPEDALPGGSYVKSCNSCKVQSGHWLTCICDGNKTSIDIDKCPSETFSNDHGNLHCGEI